MEAKMMARMLGLDETASEKQIEEKALALSGFMADALAAVGAKDSDEALGKIRAGLVAIGERNALQSTVVSQEQAALQKDFRRELKSALKEDRLDLGELRSLIPTFMKDDESKKATDAIAKLDEPPKADAPEDVRKNYRSQLLDAVCKGAISAKRFTSVRAFLSARQPSGKTPAPKTQPALTEENARVVTAAAGVTDAQVQQLAAATGIKPERAAAMLTVKSDSVEEYLKALAPKTQPQK